MEFQICITKAHYTHISVFYGHNYVRTNSYIYILLHWVSKHFTCTQAKANYSLNPWTNNTGRDCSSHVFYITCHLLIHCTMVAQLLGLLILFPYQKVKHQITACCYFLVCMWITDPESCNYRHSQFHLIGITTRKRNGEKNINGYKN